MPEKDAAQKTQEGWLQRLIDWVLADPPLYIRYFFPILVTLGIIGGIAAFWIPVETGWLRQSGLGGEAEQKSISDLRLHLLYITAGAISVLVLLKIAKEYHFLKHFIAYVNWNKNWLYIILLLTVLLGGGSAYIIPLIIPSPLKDGDTVPALRQAILVTVAGLLTMLTLWENRRKNLQEKDKNDLDHIRQIKSERRSRYAKAIEQLGNDNTSIKLGGVYTLSKLIDEWLEDKKSNPKKKERMEEGQIIIDSLCAYIRSPHPLSIPKNNDHKNLNLSDKEAENAFNDFTPLRGEQEVRKTIIKIITERLSGGVNRDGEKPKTSKGKWSNFKYDFSNSLFFYPVDFKYSYFSNPVEFTGSTFSSNADFSVSKFTQGASFSEATFKDTAMFTSAIFSGTPDSINDFSNATFTEETWFVSTEFRDQVLFTGASFMETTYFRGVDFYKLAGFRDSSFQNTADFTYANFLGKLYLTNTSFKDEVLFEETSFNEELSLSSCSFDKTVNFAKSRFLKKFESKAHFKGCADFSEVEFNYISDFSCSKFSKGLSIERASFNSYSPTFSSPGEILKLSTPTVKSHPFPFVVNKFEIIRFTQLSVRVEPKDYKLTISENSIYGIDSEQITVADGRVFTIPVGCELFDPEPLPAPKPEEKPAE